LAIDNRYQCPELAVLLLTKYNVYSTGTVRSNRKGWNKELMNCEKKQHRGTYKIACDVTNRVQAMQWVDNMVTTYCNTTIGEVQRYIAGSIRSKIPCPNGMIKYQDTMYTVDKGDQKRAHFGGFSSKAHFNKWYKKQFLAIMDCMMLNGLAAWNLSANEKKSRQRNILKRHELFQPREES
jgi:hypothetical protein